MASYSVSEGFEVKKMRSKKICFKCLGSRRKAEDNIGPLLNDEGDLITSENIEALSAFLCFCF